MGRFSDRFPVKSGNIFLLLGEMFGLHATTNFSAKSKDSNKNMGFSDNRVAQNLMVDIICFPVRMVVNWGIWGISKRTKITKT